MYFTIDDFYIKELKLKGAELLVYAVIDSFCNNTEDGSLTASIKYLSDRTGYSTRNVADALKKLSVKGLITKSLKNGELNLTFKVVNPTHAETASGDAETASTDEKTAWGDAETSSGGCENIIGTDAETASHDNKDILNNNNTSFVSLPTNSPDSDGGKQNQLELVAQDCNEKPVTLKEFSQMWNTWIDTHKLSVQHVRVNTPNPEREKKFKARQKAFADEGAYTAVFWTKLLYSVQHARDGFYVTEKDDGRNWTITMDWLIQSDKYIIKFLEAER